MVIKTNEMKICVSCGDTTEWDEDLTEEVRCVRCWDAQSEDVSHTTRDILGKFAEPSTGRAKRRTHIHKH